MENFMHDKTIWDGVLEYLKENNIDISSLEFFKAWPVIAGIRLSSCTRLISVKDIKMGKIYVSPSSLSAKSLLKIEEKRIISDWNKLFPSSKINKVVITKVNCF